MDRLPEYGEWLLSNNLIAADPPFAVLTVDFRTNSGTARHYQTTTPLARITRIAPNKFGALYQMGKDKGLLEAEYQDDQTLTISFIGTVKTTCTARPGSLVGGERPIATWATSEKLGAAIRRSLPLLPSDLRDEVAAMLTPLSLSIMAGVTVAWGISHFFGVGEVADAILLITGGAMFGWAAGDVARDLMAFVRGATSAASEADLDEAARHFAAAVSKGGVQVVMAILLWKGARAAPRRPAAPARFGELPTELNAVAPTKIPPAARAAAALAEQGQQPRLAGLAQDVAAVVRAALNRMRRQDLASGIDCHGSCRELADLARAGNAAESNASSPLARMDHTMWQVGDEVVDTRPGMWREHFRLHPELRQAVNAAVRGLAERLEQGAVMTLQEFMDFMGVRPAPKSALFDGRKVPGVRGG